MQGTTELDMLARRGEGVAKAWRHDKLFSAGCMQVMGRAKRENMCVVYM